MELDELILELADYDKLSKKITESKSNLDAVTTAIKEYDPEAHDVVDKTARPDKNIIVSDENGNDRSDIAKVNRIPVPDQKKIVQFSAAVLCTNPIQIESTPSGTDEENLLALIKKTWIDNKLDYLNSSIAEYQMSELEVAEVWFAEDVEKEYWAGTVLEGIPRKFRMKILANTLGDSLYPVFNSIGDMIAFAVGFKLTVEGKDEEHFDLYLFNKIYRGKKVGGEWEVLPEPNPAGKISIIYYSQPLKEWYDVQRMISRKEFLLSNHGDINDYFGSPTMTLEGELKSVSKKGEAGKLLELNNGAKVGVISWDSSPESMKLEMENLDGGIAKYSSTPDFSFDKIKGIGAYSGTALKMLFMDAHLKAGRKVPTFGIGVQRRLNFLKQALIMLKPATLQKANTLKLSPKFDFFMPKNVQEAIDTLASATQAGILSKKTAVTINPLVPDAEAELTQLDEEQKASQTLLSE